MKSFARVMDKLCVRVMDEVIRESYWWVMSKSCGWSYEWELWMKSWVRVINEVMRELWMKLWENYGWSYKKVMDEVIKKLWMKL